MKIKKNAFSTLVLELFFPSIAQCNRSRFKNRLPLLYSTVKCTNRELPRVIVDLFPHINLQNVLTLILLRGIQLTHVHRYRGSTVKMVLSYNTFVALPNACRCAHFPSVITTIMDHKLQLLKPFNIRESYTT
jgi:hypothetical protein